MAEKKGQDVCLSVWNMCTLLHVKNGDKGDAQGVYISNEHTPNKTEKECILIYFPL